MSQETLTSDCVAGERVLYMAIELSSKTWKLAFSDAQEKSPRIRTIDARDKAALKKEILVAKKRFHLGSDAPVRSCHEAGRDGFAVHRLLGSMGLQSAMVDPGSIERPRRKRLAKTDRLDVRMLMRKLIQYHGGDQGLWRVCRVPTAEQEDARRPHRERQRLVKERTAHRARLKSLLATEGLVLRLDKSLATRVEQLTNLAGAPVGQHKIAEIRREYERLMLVQQQLKEIEQDQKQRMETPQTPGDEQAALLVQLQGIGPISASLLAHEFFWRDFNNRKQVGSAAGLVGTPFDSGNSVREQGISKAGNRLVRVSITELAWSWLRYQPQSKLSQWFSERYAPGTKRLRKVGIVALARKLLIAMWRLVKYGEVPEGALLKRPKPA